jgi:hypothetical protein
VVRPRFRDGLGWRARWRELDRVAVILRQVTIMDLTLRLSLCGVVEDLEGADTPPSEDAARGTPTAASKSPIGTGVRDNYEVARSH